MRKIKSVTIPVMLTVLVKTLDEDNEAVEKTARKIIMDIVEQAWYDEWEYEGSTMELYDFSWMNGTFVSELGEEDESTEEAEVSSVSSNGESS